MIIRIAGSMIVLLSLSGCLLIDGSEWPEPPDPPDDLRILAPSQDWPRLDEFDVVSAVVRDDALTISVAYSGGCREHAFTFYSTGPVIKTLPPGADLLIRHDANGDQCEAFLTQDVSVDLRPIRAPGLHEVRVHILDYDLQGYTTVSYTY